MVTLEYGNTWLAGGSAVTVAAPEAAATATEEGVPVP